MIANDDDLVGEVSRNESVGVPARRRGSVVAQHSRGVPTLAHQIGVTLSSTTFVSSTSSSPGPVQYSTPLYPNPPSLKPSLSSLLMPLPFKLLSNGIASSYEIGMEGMVGMLRSSESAGRRVAFL